MTNSNNGDRLERIEAILESTAQVAQANSRDISKLVEDRRQLNTQIDRNSQQIAQLARNPAVLFEITQELSRDRVTMAENLVEVGRSKITIMRSKLFLCRST